MKQKIIFFACFLAAMAAVPAIAAISGYKIKNSAEGNNTEDKQSADIVAAAVEQVCSADFCDEGLRAAAVIMRTDLKAGMEIKVENISDKEFFSRIKKLINSDEELLLHNGKIKFIPYTYCSNGNTSFQSKYNYLSPAASPWDFYCPEYSSSDKYGVSVYGIDYLCKNKMSASEALRHYLPEFETVTSQDGA